MPVKMRSHAEAIHEHFSKGLVRIEFEPGCTDDKRYGRVIHGHLLPIDFSDKNCYGDVEEWDMDNDRWETVPNKLKVLKLTTKDVPEKFRSEKDIENEISTIGFYPNDFIEIRYIQQYELEGREWSFEKDIKLDPHWDNKTIDEIE